VLVTGVATGTFGGMMRDVVANEIPMVLRQGELYVSACLAGALLSVILFALFPSGQFISLLAGSALTFALRAGSLHFGWRLPVYRPRPPRTPAAGEPPRHRSTRDGESRTARSP
jgi:uncharacterized membrane protein YeiH